MRERTVPGSPPYRGARLRLAPALLQHLTALRDRLTGAIARRRQAWQQDRALRHLSDAQLRDIGLERDDDRVRLPGARW